MSASVRRRATSSRDASRLRADQSASAWTVHASPSARPGLAGLRTATSITASPSSIGGAPVGRSNASRAVQQGCERFARANAARARLADAAIASACSAGRARTSSSNGPTTTSPILKCQPSGARSIRSTCADQWTSSRPAMTASGASIDGVPTHASGPAAGQGAATPAASQARSRSTKPGARAVMYCAP